MLNTFHTYSKNCVTKCREQADHVLFSFLPIMCTCSLFGIVEHAFSQSCGAFKLLMDNDLDEKIKRENYKFEKCLRINKMNAFSNRHTDEQTRVLW